MKELRRTANAHNTAPRRQFQCFTTPASCLGHIIYIVSFVKPLHAFILLADEPPPLSSADFRFRPRRIMPLLTPQQSGPPAAGIYIPSRFGTVSVTVHYFLILPHADITATDIMTRLEREDILADISVIFQYTSRHWRLSVK